MLVFEHRCSVWLADEVTQVASAGRGDDFGRRLQPVRGERSQAAHVLPAVHVVSAAGAHVVAVCAPRAPAPAAPTT